MAQVQRVVRRLEDQRDSNSAPLGTSLGHAVASALPKAMFTNVRISSTVT